MAGCLIPGSECKGEEEDTKWFGCRCLAAGLIERAPDVPSGVDGGRRWQWNNRELGVQK